MILRMESIDEYARRVIKALPESIRDTAILAGGALRAYFDGTDAKDFDIFFRTHADYLQASAVMEQRYDRLLSSLLQAPSFVVPGLESPVNIIGFRHADPVDLVESFDFTACAMAAYLDPCAKGGVAFVYVDGAQAAAAQRLLSINRVRPTKRLLKRSARYIEKYGYEITDQFVEKFRESFDAEDDEGEPIHSS